MHINVRNAGIAIVSVIAALSFVDAHAASPTTKPESADKQPTTTGAITKEAVRAVDTTIPVLERFRTYTGPRTPAALRALFAQSPVSGIRQQPAIALSDGASTVTIVAAVSLPKDTALNLATNGARMISYERLPKGELQVVALPEVGIWKAELIVLTDSTTLEIPITIAPPLPVETDLSEKGFTSFLGGKIPGKQPLLDLNGDGQRNYLDDYIFTANYLARLRAGSHGAEKQAPVEPEEANLNQIDDLQNTDTSLAPESQYSDVPQDSGAKNTAAQSIINSPSVADRPSAPPPLTPPPTPTPTPTPTPSQACQSTQIFDRAYYNTLSRAQQAKYRSDQAIRNKNLVTNPCPVE